MNGTPSLGQVGILASGLLGDCVFPCPPERGVRFCSAFSFWVFLDFEGVDERQN